jgi:phosphopantothenoylcysteine decarboxylase/phosphopantothenate--cysteine ligase
MMRVLITSGATREPIDSVRFITNFSTGQTGAELADYFCTQGAEVFYLSGQGAAQPRSQVQRIDYGSFSDLDGKLREILASQSLDLVIHAAAVSDYSVKDAEAGKMDSSQEKLNLELQRNFKIVEKLKSYSPSRQPRVVAFKLTDTSDAQSRKEAIEKLSLNPSIDWVVHNDFSGIRSGQREFSIFERDRCLSQCESRMDLGKALYELVQDEVIA